jgi:2-amino-4-hydroxy-6-hydroxymethyldihydropteridine diphosphokinase
LDRIQEIEKMLGREEKREKNQPRTIDIDIIIFKNSFIETNELQIPHPGSLYRKFVLIPLSELIPNEIFPKTNIKIVDLLEKCPDTSVVEKYMIDKKA